MARKVHARRYAQAIFDIALETKELDRWQSDLRKIVGLSGDGTLNAWVQNPKLRFDVKARLLSERLGDISPLALNLACLLVSKGRFNMASDIADEYQRLLDSHRGIEQAEVITTIPLDDKDKLKLGEHLGTMVSKKVVVTSEVDHSLIGGIMVRVGGKLLDGSTRSQLITLRQEMVGSGR